MARKPTEVVTGEVRISYEHLLKPYANQTGAEPKYSATLLIPKTDLATKQRIDAAIQAAIQEGVAGKWNGARPAQPAIPIYDGDGLRPNGEAFGEECRGHWVMTAGSKIQQEIVDMAGNPVISPTEIYSGMYARVFINFFAYHQSGKKGIGCGLGPVQKTRDGEPLGGKVTAAEVFGAADSSGFYPAPPAYPAAAVAPPAPTTQTVPYPAAYPSQSTPAYALPPQIDPITGAPMSGIYGL